jgi:REP element-mobilizing transposase RayT
LPAIVRAFKSAVTREVNIMNGTPGATLWQWRYYEHIVRDEADLDRIRAYIANNPHRWKSSRR